MGMSRAPGTLVDALFGSGVITQAIFTLCLTSGDGRLTVGGVNTSTHLSPAVYTPMSESGSGFHSVRLHDVLLRGTSLGVAPPAYISGSGCFVDSGTTFTYFPSVAYEALNRMLMNECVNGV